MAVATAAPEQAVPDRGVRVKIVCSHCERVFTRHSRKGYTATCPHCHTVNAGPALLAEQQKEKAPGARRRVVRRERRAEERAAPAPAAAEVSPSTPAPVRRKRTASSSAPPAAPEPEKPAPQKQQPAVPSGAASPPQRGWLDRLVYGDGDDGE